MSVVTKQEVKIPNVGYELAADWYETESDQALLILPGYTSTKEKYQELAKAVVGQTGHSALVLDYAGHGKSPFDINDLSRADNFSDAVAAFDWLSKKAAGKKITVIGTSYGGFHAAYLTKFRQFHNVIFRVPAPYPEETLYTKIGDLADAHAEAYRNDSTNFKDNWLFTHASSVKGRALVITHEFDTVCPPVATKPFVEAFNADTWEAPGFKHGFHESEVSEQQIQDYYKKISEWINQK